MKYIIEIDDTPKNDHERYILSHATPLTDCTDAISRARVIEWLMNASDDSIEHAIDSNLEFIPTVNPTRPKAKWIRHGACNYTCSECGFPVNQKYDFCVCGAEMESDSDA